MTTYAKSATKVCPILPINFDTYNFEIFTSTRHSHSSIAPSPLLLTFSKLIEMRRGGGGLKIFTRKGALGQHGAINLEIGGCHIILKFFWRFLIMQHRKIFFDAFHFLILFQIQQSTMSKLPKDLTADCYLITKQKIIIWHLKK